MEWSAVTGQAELKCHWANQVLDLVGLPRVLVSHHVPIISPWRTLKTFLFLVVDVHNIIILFIYSYVELRIEPNASHMLGKCYQWATTPLKTFDGLASLSTCVPYFHTWLPPPLTAYSSPIFIKHSLCLETPLPTWSAYRQLVFFDSAQERPSSDYSQVGDLKWQRQVTRPRMPICSTCCQIRFSLQDCKLLAILFALYLGDLVQYLCLANAQQTFAE